MDTISKAVNIFVTSCHQDFHAGRHVLLNEVLMDLKSWCLSLGKELNFYDVRWGGGQSSGRLDKLEGILKDMQHLYFKKEMPFFLNFTSPSLGLIPLWGDSDTELVKKFMKHFNLSQTEMEVLYMAHREDNPNCIFLLRNDKFLAQMGSSAKASFITPESVHAVFHKQDSDLLRKKYPEERILEYDCTYVGGKNVHQALIVEDSFKTRLMVVLRAKISEGMGAAKPVDPFEIMNLMQKDFLKTRSRLIRGREEDVKIIEDYITQNEKDVPLVVLGESGSGKTSLLCKAAETILVKASKSELPAHGDAKWQVFYHFVGAVPGSTDLEFSAKRFLREFGIVQQESAMPNNITAVCQMCCHHLSNPATRPSIVFIDAINQFSDSKDVSVLSWLPRKLAPQNRCIISMINDSKEYEILQARESKAQELHLKPLSMEARRLVASDQLEKNFKPLSNPQMDRLLEKQSSANPLWLAFACEELCEKEDNTSINNDIDNLEEGLTNLLEMVLQRKESGMLGTLVRAVLCLLEVSASGLLEAELRTILADEKNLMPPSPYDEKEETEKAEKESNEKECKKKSWLKDERWGGVCSTLKPLLRPYGHSGDGRIDFFHRAVSKAVRKRYFSIGSSLNDCEDEGQSVKLWWHGKLADYFEETDNLQRKVEELPYQLVQIRDTSRLSKCLTDWRVFDCLFNEEYSAKLLLYWRMMGDEEMVSAYRKSLQQLEDEVGSNLDYMARQYELIARVFLQAGQYVDSLELASTAMKLEEQELNKRPERMVELYLLMSEIYDAKLKLNDFVSPSQLPDLRKTISLCEKSIEIRQKLPGDYHKSKLAISLMKLAFSLESWEACGADLTFQGDAALEQGNKHIEVALEIFKSLNDQGHYAEALMTKGVLATRGSMEQLKLYNEALDICMQLYGERHILMSRLYINIGIVYEDNKDYLKSYEYFKKWARVSEEVLGPNHPKTLRAKGVLNEPRYRTIAQRLEESGNNMGDNSLHFDELEVMDNLTSWIEQQHFQDSDELPFLSDEGDEESRSTEEENHYNIDCGEIETHVNTNSNSPENDTAGDGSAL